MSDDAAFADLMLRVRRGEAQAAEQLLRFLLEVCARMSKEEQTIANPRADGRSWADVAQELGGTAEARRKQLQRVADRVGRELGLESDNG